MSEYKIVMPSKPRVVLEEANKGVFEIDGLYPGYGHTLGNSLRRIILSSLPGASVTSIKIDGVSHEFQTLEGIKEDVIVMILNLKKTRFKMISDEPQTVSLSVKGPKAVTAGDIKTGGQVEILNPELHIVEVTGKINLNIEMKIEKGLGFIPKELFQKEKVDVGTIAVDAIFTPVRWVSYEVENMRVGDKTNHNRLRISIETDGTLSAREALSRSIEIMINQLKAIIDFKEPEEEKVKKDKDVEDKKPARHASQGDAGGSILYNPKSKSGLIITGANTLQDNFLSYAILAKNKSKPLAIEAEMKTILSLPISPLSPSTWRNSARR